MSQTILEPNNRILVIDDNPSIHEDFRKILGEGPPRNAHLDTAEAALFGDVAPVPEKVRFDIDSAFQGVEGLAMVQQALQDNRPYALAFVDVRMPPGWDGVETITHLWQTYPELQVVICSAYSDYSWEEIARKLGSTDNMIILKKPFDNIEVLQLAHTLSQKWLLTEQNKSRLTELDRIVSERTQDLQRANQKLYEEVQARRQTETALRLSEERFEKAFRANPIAMAIQSFNHERYVDVNDSFVQLLGMTYAEFIGRTPGELPASMDEASWAQARNRLKAGQAVRHFACPWRLKTGEVRQTLVCIEMFNLGQEPYLLLLVQDLTEQKKLENQLRHSQKMEAVGQLAAGVAHDFNNILTIIQGHVSLQLSSRQLDREIAESLQEVSTAAERATRLTRQLLAFSRRQVIQRKSLDLNQLLGELSKMLQRLIGENIRLRCDLQSNLPHIYADAGNLEQVMMNLAVNARDAMPEGGCLTLCTRIVEVDESHLRQNPEARVGRFVCLNVSDTGCGIESGVLSHIFEPFFTTKEVGKGTGMGLAMIYGILKQHDGWIEVTSRPGQGATFQIYLPLNGTLSAMMSAAESVTGDQTAPARGQPGTSPASTPLPPAYTILVVEDEPGVRSLVKMILQNHGYRTLEAENGVAALQVWREQQGKVDLLLTDMIMPEGISGQKLAEQLLQENARLKVIYSSGYTTELVDQARLIKPGHRFLSKPYHPQALLDAVRWCLEASAPDA